MGASDLIFTSFCYGASMLSLYHLYLFLHPLRAGSVTEEPRVLAAAIRPSLLILLFMVQHSVMASKAFKQRM
jgi:hypothetical protein